MAAEPLILAVQDTCYLNYTHHPATTGLGQISGGQQGLVMHTTTRGDFQKRDDFLVLAIEDAEKLGDTTSLIVFLALRTRTLCYLGDVETALACLDQARSLLSTILNPDPSVVESLNEAHMRVCFRLGDVVQQLALARANVTSASERDSPAEILYRYYIADYHFLAGNDPEAEDQFLTLIGESKQEQFQRGVMYAWLMLAKIALRRKDVRSAEERLRRTQILAEEMKHRRFLAETNRVWASLYTLRGDLPAARIALAESIDLFERLGMRREFTEAREAMADLNAHEHVTAE
jgi:tetratricopeptide (TPR) repeat protein